MTAGERVDGIVEGLAGLAVPVDDLRPLDGNPRRGDVAAVAKSLEVFGQRKPIVVRADDGTIIAGNHTWQAARKLGWTHIAAVRVDDDPGTANAYALADNRTAELGGYDNDALAALIEQVAQLDDPALFGATGWTDGDLAKLLAEIDPGGLTDPDDAPDAPAAPDAICELGDVWLLGPHRLLVGDSTDSAAVLAMLGRDRADCVWTDPPYGVNYVVGKTKDALTIRNDGAKGLGALLAGAFGTVVAACKPGAPVYVAHADAERMTFEQAMRDAGLVVRQNLIWVKNTIVLGRSDYHYQHEPLLYGFTGDGEGRLGRGGARWHGGNRSSTVFQIPKPPRNADHPTMKPVELITAMLENSCPPEGLVLDLFGGSGATLIAAHHRRARAALVELDPRYADVICRRYQEHAGVLPVLAATGKSRDFSVDR